MSKKILVVDEKSVMLRLIQHHLEQAGYELIKARNQGEANDAITQQSPHLVIMNEGPESSRKEKQFKPKNSLRNIPVIRVTDLAQNLQENGLPMNDDVILTKPFSPTRFMDEVKRLTPDSN
ncbi:MAG: response regulator [Verrucomicrobiota bacterium]